ncbi:MAG TPA: MFS transporter [Marmoricola sp.]|nr:MFS transporter [Marmoricola sp.]
MSSSRRGLVLVVMCVGYFLVLLDVTVVNVALPGIGTDLGSSVSGLQWVVDGYAVTLAALLLAAGTIGDVLGHKPVVLTGMVVFGLASAGCAAAPSTGVLVAARVAQGLGAALLLPGTLAVISQAFPAPAEQARAIGVWAGIGSVALPAGPLLGGLLVDGPGWRWVFLLNVPVLLVAGAAAARLVAADRPAHERRLDPGGTTAGAITLAAATYAVIELGRAGPGAPVVVAALVAAVAATVFVLVERRTVQPMLPLELFRRPSFTVANAAAGAMNLGTLGLLFLLTLYLQGTQDRSALAAGVAMLPLFLPLMLLAPVGGAVISRIGPRLPAVAGLLLAAVGVALMATWTAGSSYLALLPTLLLWGVGLAALTPAVVSAAIASVPSDRAGLASGINNTARQAGGAIGIAAYGAVAGPPAATSHFLRGIHVTGPVTALLWVAAAACVAVLVPTST